MKRFGPLCLGLFLCLTISALAGGTVTLPANVLAKAGRMVKITATSATPIKWVFPDADVDVIQLDANDIIFSSPTAGTYKILAYTGDKDGPSDPAVCVVTVVSAPAPAPPNPTPTPVPAPPADVLAAPLQAAYTAETDAGKATDLKSLASLYSQAAKWAEDPTVTTWGALFSELQTAGTTLGVKGHLPGVQAVLQQELTKLYPVTTQQAITDADRASAAKTFARFATLLGAVK